MRADQVSRGVLVRTKYNGDLVAEITGWCDDDPQLVEFWLYGEDGQALGMGAAYPEDLKVVRA
jgi:hypothetical protein